MHACVRGPAPELLAQHAQAIGDEYASRRAANAKYRFQWPQRGGIKLYEVAHTALDAMTAGRCAYCDGFPIDATGEEQVDHFRPKSRPEFYALVCAWDNLFLICTAVTRPSSISGTRRCCAPTTTSSSRGTSCTTPPAAPSR